MIIRKVISYANNVFFISLFSLLFWQSVCAESMLFFKMGKYVGYWDSCEYPDRGGVAVNIQSVGDDWVRIYYEIEGSPIFDGTPYPSKKIVNFGLDIGENARRATLTYQFPFPYLNFLSGFFKKSIILKGCYENLVEGGKKIHVSDEDLDLKLTISGKRIYGTSLLSKNGFRMSHKVSNNTSH